MRTVNIREAKAQLSKLVERAANGESLVIAKAGKPLVKVVPLDAPDLSKPKRWGFMAGQISVPADFDTLGAVQIEDLIADYGPPARLL